MSKNKEKLLTFQLFNEALMITLVTKNYTNLEGI